MVFIKLPWYGSKVIFLFSCFLLGWQGVSPKDPRQEALSGIREGAEKPPFVDTTRVDG
jgi:hypothetical protein